MQDLRSGGKWQVPTAVDYSIFALLSHITQQLLYRTHQPSLIYFQLVKGKEDNCVGKKFDPQLLATLTMGELGSHLQTGLQVECTGDVPKTLINHGHLAHIVGRLIPCMRNLPKKIILSTKLVQDHLRFVVPQEIGKFLNKSDDRVLLAKSDGERLGIDLTYDGGDLVLKVPYDGPAVCDYSAYQPVDAAEVYPEAS